MAGFELTRIGTMGEIAREWRGAKYIPLYVAGIAIGVAAGVGLTMGSVGQEAPATAGAAQVAEPSAASFMLQAPPEFRLAPSIVGQPDESVLLESAQVVIPDTLFVPLPSVPEPSPVEDAPAVAPIAAPAPSAPAARPSQSAPVATKPAPAPAPAAAPAAPEAAPAAPVAAPAPAPAAPAAVSDFYVPAVSGGGASSLELRLFDGMNAERAKAGLAPFTYDAGLTKVARTRSQQMADQGYFGHVDPYGYSMYTALLKYFGYTSYAWAGENLAMNNYGVGEASERSLVTLMNSPTHRANILASDFYRVGVGEVTTADGRHIFTMIFLG